MRSEGGGGEKAPGATAATQAEAGREPAVQKGAAAMRAIPAKSPKPLLGPGSCPVPLGMQGPRTQGAHSSRT